MLDVPVIDIASIDRDSVRQAIHAACRDWGFFQVVGHDIPPICSAAMAAAATGFFNQPTAHKNRIVRSADNPWGFFDAELTKNTPDWKEIVDIGPARGVQQPQWPEQPNGFRPAMQEYAAAAEVLARELTGVVLHNLGDEQGRELDGFDDHTSFLRLNYYPPCPNPAPADLPLAMIANDSTGRLGISHHTDAGALTVLQQYGPAGLQVLHQGSWNTVSVMADALVINIGDIAQVWSNDEYVAPLHRVLANADEERYSAAWFYNPDFAYSYSPLGLPENSANYSTINWGEFRAGRTAGDYADDGDEIQIEHFRKVRKVQPAD